jgi:hypothetical protein
MGIFRRLRKNRIPVIRQRAWTHEELRRHGFRYYACRKRVTLARRLPPEEAPKVIYTPWDTIIAQAGYYILYQPGETVQDNLDDYAPRPVEPHIFAQTYAPYRDPDWQPTPAEAHLIRLGCKPFYKTVGVWARRLTEPTYVLSLESVEPSLAPVGAWLCVGSMGEHWTVTDEWFMMRYIVPAGVGD